MRTMLGLSAQDCADKLYEDIDAITRLERGLDNDNPDLQRRYERMLGINENWLYEALSRRDAALVSEMLAKYSQNTKPTE